jgi:hypothetical protein
MQISARGLLVVLVLLFLVGCAGPQSIPEPNSPGAKLYQNRCAQCHGLPGVTRHTPEQWDQLLVMMDDFMQKKNIEFSDQEKKLIREYLHRNSK